jgi:hypothetical protein
MKAKKKTSFLIHYDLESKINLLSDGVAGMLLKAAFGYAINGTIPDTDDLGFKLVFSDIQKDIDEDEANYNEKCLKNKEAIEKRWDEYRRTQTNTDEYECKKNDTKDTDNHNHNHNDIKKEIISKDIKEKQVFQTPTMDEISSYIKENNYNVDGQRFYDFYSSKGWMIGKNKMKDWKAAIRTWSRSDKKTNSKQLSFGREPLPTEYNLDDFQRLQEKQ